MSAVPRVLVEITSADAAQAYLRSLPPEHFMEAVTQAFQRKITVASLDQVAAECPAVQNFNELLIQNRYEEEPNTVEQVVPDNMVVLYASPIQAEGSYDIPLQPCKPLWVMEYVSKSNKRKDYEESFAKYERMGIRYYMIFAPDTQKLTFYKHTGTKYRAMRTNAHGRYELPELELEVGLLDGWVRYWFRGQLLPLTGELHQDLKMARRQLDAERRVALREKQRADREKRRADQEKRRADEEKQRADEEKQRAHKLDQLVQAEAQRAKEAAQREEEAARRVETERQARLAAERELTKLRAQMAKPGKRGKNGS